VVFGDIPTRLRGENLRGELRKNTADFNERRDPRKRGLIKSHESQRKNRRGGKSRGMRVLRRFRKADVYYHSSSKVHKDYSGLPPLPKDGEKRREAWGYAVPEKIRVRYVGERGNGRKGGLKKRANRGRGVFESKERGGHLAIVLQREDQTPKERGACP